MMTYYLPVALVCSGLFFFLSYYGYKTKGPGFVFVCGLGLLLILRLMTALYPGIWNTDEAEWVSLARTLPNCDVPYRCYDAHSTGYFSIFILKSFHYLGIPYTYSSMRVFGLFFFFLPSITLFYFTIKHIYNYQVVTLGITLLLHYYLFGAHCYDLFAYNSEYIVMLFISITYYCYIRYTRDKKFIGLVIAAICIGIMPLSKLQSLPLAFGFTVLFFIYFFKNKRFRDLFIFCAVGIVPLGITLLVFWRLGVVWEFWQMYIVANRYLVNHYSNTNLFGRVKVFIYLQRWLTPYYVLMFLMLFMAWRGKKLNWSIIREIDFGQLLVLLCAYFSVAATGTGAEHYLTLLMIPFFLVLTNIISALDIEVYLGNAKRLAWYSLLLAGIAVMFLVLPEFKPWKERIYHMKRPVKTNLVAYVQKYIPAGDPLCVIGWFDAVEVQVSCERPLATRTAHNFYLLADKDTALMHFFQQQYISDLERSKPLLVIDPSYDMDSLLMQPVKEYILGKYQFDTVIDDSRVFKRINQ